MKPLKFRKLLADEVECRISVVKGNGVSLLLYKDARCDMNILDEVVGPMNWQRFHNRDNANCTVSIWDDDRKIWYQRKIPEKKAIRRRKRDWLLIPLNEPALTGESAENCIQHHLSGSVRITVRSKHRAMESIPVLTDLRSQSLIMMKKAGSISWSLKMQIQAWLYINFLKKGRKKWKSKRNSPQTG